MNETLPNKIDRIEAEISDLEQAIDIVKKPPKYKVDETEYQALGEVRRLLAEARSEEESNQRLLMLKDQLGGLKIELDRLKQLLKAKQERIESLKAKQAKEFEKFKAIERDLLSQLQVVMAYGQSVASEDSDLTRHSRPGIVFAVNTKTLNRLMDVSLTDGRVVLSVKSSDLFEFVPDGLGGFTPVIPSFQHLIQAKKEVA